MLLIVRRIAIEHNEFACYWPEFVCWDLQLDGRDLQSRHPNFGFLIRRNHYFINSAIKLSSFALSFT